MTTRALLTRSIDRLNGHAHRFTTGALARNAAGQKVKPSSPYARSWCAIGLVLSEAGQDRIPADGPVHEAVELLDRAAGEQGFLSAMRCADEAGHAGAMRMLRRALQLLNARG